LKRTSPESRLRNRRIAAWSLLRRVRRRGYGRAYGQDVRSQGRFIEKGQRPSFRTPGASTELRGRLDFQEDPNGTLTQLEWLADYHPKMARFRVHILMDRVTHIDAPSLLFLCSRIRRLRRLGGLVTGSYPKDERALKTLLDADFPGFLSGRPPKFDRSTRTLQLHEGVSESELDPRVAADIKQFLAHLAPDLTAEEVDHIYMAAIECLENVRVHAYRKDERQVHGSWYAVGLYDPVDECSTVAILDLGFGMRATVQRQLSAFMKFAELAIVETSALIREATLGLRTETQERHRGKGLNRLREFAVGAGESRLSVYSGNGSVAWSRTEDGTAAKVPPFDGTIVCLRVAKGKNGRSPGGN
jgi:hypothetical protein